MFLWLVRAVRIARLPSQVGQPTAVSAKLTFERETERETEQEAERLAAIALQQTAQESQDGTSEIDARQSELDSPLGSSSHSPKTSPRPDRLNWESTVETTQLSTQQNGQSGGTSVLAADAIATVDNAFEPPAVKTVAGSTLAANGSSRTSQFEFDDPSKAVPTLPDQQTASDKATAPEQPLVNGNDDLETYDLFGAESGDSPELVSSQPPSTPSEFEPGNGGASEPQTGQPIEADNSGKTVAQDVVSNRPVDELLIIPDVEQSKSSDSLASSQNRIAANLPANKLPAAAGQEGGPSMGTQGTTKFVLAGQPKMGDHFKDDRPVTDKRAWLIPTPEFDFSSDAIDPSQPYCPEDEMDVYQGKTLNANQRPLLEIGRPWYQLGQLSEGATFLGLHNVLTPQLIVHGDFRTAVASNQQNGDGTSQWAFQWNMNLDLRLTSTERIVSFINPLGAGNQSRLVFDDGEFVEEFDADLDFGYLEGDLGAIVGGLVGETLPFDLPFAVGFMPLLVQNGIWLEDAILGAAVTVPARNSPSLHISNMDITFFAAYDEIDSPAFAGDDDVAKMYGVLAFIEAMNGYFEFDYAFLEDRDGTLDRSYHNIGVAFTRRYGRFLSNSIRVLANAGQSVAGGPNTADGVLFLVENSLITRHPSTIVPYFNLFAGFDRPQSAARAGAAGGVLRNTGILFESDNLTGYPTLDASANDTAGAALGVNLLAADFSQQLVLEVAALGVLNSGVNRNALGDQYGIGFRHQLPLSNNIILRTDGMIGFLRGDEDVSGIRFELRHKF